MIHTVKNSSTNISHMFQHSFKTNPTSSNHVSTGSTHIPNMSQPGSNTFQTINPKHFKANSKNVAIRLNTILYTSHTVSNTVSRMSHNVPKRYKTNFKHVSITVSKHFKQAATRFKQFKTSLKHCQPSRETQQHSLRLCASAVCHE